MDIDTGEMRALDGPQGPIGKDGAEFAAEQADLEAELAEREALAPAEHAPRQTRSLRDVQMTRAQKEAKRSSRKRERQNRRAGRG